MAITTSNGFVSSGSTFADVVADSNTDTTWYKISNSDTEEYYTEGAVKTSGDWVSADSLSQMNLPSDMNNFYVKSYGSSGQSDWVDFTVAIDSEGFTDNSTVDLADATFDPGTTVTYDQVIDASNLSDGSWLRVYNADEDTYLDATGDDNGWIKASELGDFSFTTGAAGETDQIWVDQYLFNSGRSGWENAKVTSQASTTTDDNSYTVATGAVVSDDLANLVANDAEGDNLSVISVGNPTGGDVGQIGGDKFSFIPTDDAVRKGSFDYTVEDSAGNQDTGTVNIDFNTAPTVEEAATATADEDMDATGTLTATDANNDDMTFAAVADSATDGTVEVSKDGSYTFTPEADFNGEATFQYTATDEYGGESEAATATMTVNAVNDAPAVAEDAMAETIAGTSGDIDLSNPDYVWDVDEGDTLSFTVDTDSVTTGTLVDNGDDTVTYTPNDGQMADDSVSFTVTDGNIKSPVDGTISIDVTNEAPTAEDVSLTSQPANQSVSVDVTSSDADTGQTVELVQGEFSGNADGTVQKDDGDTLVYTPNSGWTGTEEFTFTVTDGFEESEANVSVEVVKATGGTDGDDVLGGGTDAESIDGLKGDDIIDGGGGEDTITGGLDDDLITFNQGAVQVAGGPGNDTLEVNSGSDLKFDLSKTGNTVTGDQWTGSDTDNNPVVSGFENIDGSDAQTAMTSVKDSTGDNVISTGVGDDSVTIAKGGNDTVNTGAGDDTIDGATLGSDVVDGGVGTDKASIDNSGAITDADFANLSNVEGLSFPNADNITLGTQAAALDFTQISAGAALTLDATGFTADMAFTLGATGNDITGGAGDDTIKLDGDDLTSADTIDGGGGTNAISVTDDVATALADGDFSNVSNVETLAFAEGVTHAGTNALGANAELAGIVNVTGATNAALDLDFTDYTSAGITVTSGSKADTIQTGQGDDVVSAGKGDDTIEATQTTGGNDELTGGAGDDTFNFATAELTGDDTIDGGDNGTAGDKISITDKASLNDADFANVSNVENLALGSDAANSVVLGANAEAAGITMVAATTGTNTIDASAYATAGLTVSLGSNDDEVTGGAGDDTIKLDGDALTSADTIDGGDGTDTINVTATGALTDTNFSNVSNVETLAFADGVTGATATLESDAEAAGIVTVTGATNEALSLDAAAYTSAGITVTSGSQTDTIQTGQGDDVVSVGEGDDTITITTGGNDELIGGAGDDTFNFATAELTGDDTIDGGDNSTAGVDAISIIDAASLVDGDFSNVSNIENLALGSSAANSVVLGANAETAGITTVAAATGTDTIDASAYSTGLTVSLGANDDDVTGGAGDDTIKLDGDALDTNDTIDGGDGTDTIKVTDNVDTALADSDFSNVSNVETLVFDKGITGATATLGSNAEAAGIVTVTGATDKSLSLDAAAYTSAGITVTSGSQADTIKTGDGNDDISVGKDNDTVTSGDGDDTVGAGDGDDTVDLHNAGDQVDGGAGADTLDINAVTGGSITVDLSNAGDQMTEYNGNDNSVIQTGFENVDGAGVAGSGLNVTGSTATSIITGSDQSDIIDGGAGDNKIIGNAGVDDIDGGSGEDTITGDIGDDIIDGGSGDDDISGNVGDDSIDGGTGDDDISGNVGADEIYARGGDDAITGGDGADTIDGGNGLNDIYGNAGVDIIDGGGDSDTIYGNAGADTIDSGSGDDSLTGGAGDDTFNFATAELTSDDTIDGGDNGTAGDKIFITNKASLVDGDFVNVSNVENLTLAAGVDGSVALGTNAEAAGITTVVATAGADEIDASDYSTGLTVSLGSNTDNITGGAGDDTIKLDGDALTGADTIDGGDGTDTIKITDNVATALADSDFSNVSNVETLAFAEGVTGATATLSANAEKTAGIVTVTEAGNEALSLDATAYTSAGITVTSGSGADTIETGAGGDTIDSGSGDDTVDAGGDDDTVYLRDAGDQVAGRAGTDLLSIDDNLDTGSITIDLSNTSDQMTQYNGSDNGVEQTGFEDVDGAVVTGDYGLDVTGSTSANTITGSDQGDTIKGGDGGDVIIGNDGIDEITGGVGADEITLGAGSDTVVFNQFAYADVVTDFVSGTDAMNIYLETGGSGNAITDSGGVGASLMNGATSLNVFTTPSGATVSIDLSDDVSVTLAASELFVSDTVNNLTAAITAAVPTTASSGVAFGEATSIGNNSTEGLFMFVVTSANTSVVQNVSVATLGSNDFSASDIVIV